MFNEQKPEQIEWHPNAVKIYQQKVADLSTALSADDVVRYEAAAALRNLVDKIMAYHGDKRGQFEL